MNRTLAWRYPRRATSTNYVRMSASRRHERVHRPAAAAAPGEEVQATADRCAALEHSCCAPVTRWLGVLARGARSKSGAARHEPAPALAERASSHKSHAPGHVACSAERNTRDEREAAFSRRGP